MSEKDKEKIEAEKEAKLKEIADRKKKTALRKYTYRGKELDDLVKLTNDQLSELFKSRQRRRFLKGLKHSYNRFMLKIRHSKKNCVPGEKPEAVKTHMRDAIITPEMIGSVIGIHNGRDFTNVEIKFDMIGRYLGEFSMTYKPTKHSKPGIGATKGSFAAKTAKT